ncbi:MAG: antitoxin [Actinobacteria bacterium 69-20]|nr:antitoxin [Actinomycetota bacterium]OJV25042.1 MAG: antitoxin [Actinobacteria bacterium 69-20]
MAARTSTIRVSRAARDALAAQARERGVSLSALLAEVADERHREAMWRSEREASNLDLEDPDVQAELDDWESTVGDSIG